MKGYVRIGGALVLGIFIVSSALVMQRDGGNEALAGQVIVSDTPNRNYVDAKDLDGNGVKDWKEDSLFATIETPTSTLESAEAYAPPTTLTGKFSEAFFKDYMEGKIRGEDFSDPTKLVGNAIQAIDANTQSKRHTRLELTIIEDSDEAIREYGNQVASIIKTHSINNENEAVILQQALTANDPTILEKLSPIHNVYANIIADSLRISVPVSFVSKHLELLNAYETILTDIEAMQAAFGDPLYALARVRGYESDATILFTALQTIGETLTNGGVTYTNDEPGSFFYLFDT